MRIENIKKAHLTKCRMCFFYCIFYKFAYVTAIYRIHLINNMKS